MRGDGGEREAALAVLLEQLDDEVLRLGADVRRERDGRVLDAVVRLLLLRRLERRAADEELVHEDAERPRVDALVVRLLAHHLRREVVERAAHRLAPQVRRVHRPAKVRDLHHPVRPDQQVLRLDVAVDHVLLVAKVQRVRQRLDVLFSPVENVCEKLAGTDESVCCGHRTNNSSTRLGEAADIAQNLEELAALRKLEDEEDAPLVVEEAVHPQNVGVSVAATAATGETTAAVCGRKARGEGKRQTGDESGFQPHAGAGAPGRTSAAAS